VIQAVAQWSDGCDTGTEGAAPKGAFHVKKRIEWYEHTAWLNEALRTGGAFLVAVDADGKPNPMTIGWGQVGIVWSVPAFTVLVRESRYTHGCIRHASAFTVNVPRPGDLADALKLCGSMSGRDIDKAADAGLSMVPATEVEGMVIEQCPLQYECRILARTQQHLDDLAAEEVLRTFYPHGDYHLVVIGRIIAAFAEQP
jgi:flavin reductase (DIM6/NTAB) family NADH-FMN oxidoreductase RutF